MSGTEEEGWVVLPAPAAGSDAVEGRIDALSIKEEKPQSPGGMLIDVGADDKPKKGPRRKFVPTQRKGPVIPRSLSGGSPAPKAGQSVLPRSLSGGGGGTSFVIASKHSNTAFYLRRTNITDRTTFFH